MSLLVVVPICAKDAALAEKLLLWIGELGECSQPVLLLFSPDVTEEDRGRLFFLAMQVFSFAVSDVARLRPYENGWPDGPNAMFRNASILAPKLNRGPWYFFEPDNTPMRTGWLDEIERAHRDSHASFFGSIESEWWHSKTTGQSFLKQKYLMGSAVYPWDIMHFTSKHLNVRGRPFDVEIASDIMPHTKSAPLIQNNWRTKNYRRQSGLIACDKVEHGAAGQSLSRVVDERCAVVHGCRDASLMTLLSQERELLSASRCQQPQIPAML